MDLEKTERLVLSVSREGGEQTMVVNGKQPGWACVISDEGGEYERTFDFPEDLLLYLGRTLLDSKGIRVLESR